MVEVQKLRTFCDFCWPCATLCGDRARRSALAVAPCEFVLVSANPLRRSHKGAVRRGYRGPRLPPPFLCNVSDSSLPLLISFSASGASPQALVVVAPPSAHVIHLAVQNAFTSLHRGLQRLRMLRTGAEILADGLLVCLRVEVLSLWRRAIFLLAKRPLEVVSWFVRLLSQSRGRGFDSPLVRGSSGLKIVTFKYRRSTRSVLLQLRLKKL